MEWYNIITSDDLRKISQEGTKDKGLRSKVDESEEDLIVYDSFIGEPIYAQDLETWNWKEQYSD